MQCVGFVDFLTYLRLLYRGFHFHRLPFSQFFKLFPFRPIALITRYKSPAKHLTYWHRPHTSKTKLPVLFVHGIGIGLYPYVPFFTELNSQTGLEDGSDDDQVGIIAVELMPVSFRITHAALSKDETCREIAAILKHHGYEKVVLVSHSLGTVVSTHLLQHPSTSSMIGPMVLIDPVSIMLHLPDVAYNFIKRQPTTANEHQLYYFASMDMAVSHTLCRHFFWNENVLWKKDVVGRKVTISIGERDCILNGESLGRYLTKNSGPNDGGYDEERSTSQTSGVLVDLSTPELVPTENGHAEVDGNSKSVGNLADEINAQDVGLKDQDVYTDDADDSVDAWKSRPWTGDGIDVLWNPGLDHAQIFDKASGRRRLVLAIRSYCETEGPMPKGAATPDKND
jgi:hypothetical protein